MGRLILGTSEVKVRLAVPSSCPSFQLSGRKAPELPNSAIRSPSLTCLFEPTRLIQPRRTDNGRTGHGHVGSRAWRRPRTGRQSACVGMGAAIAFCSQHRNIVVIIPLSAPQVAEGVTLFGEMSTVTRPTGLTRERDRCDGHVQALTRCLRRRSKGKATPCTLKPPCHPGGADPRA